MSGRDLPASLLEIIPGAAALVDVDGVLKQVSSRFCALAGAPPDRLSGQPAAIVFGGMAESARLLEHIARSPDQATPPERFVVRRGDGEERPVLVAASRMPDGRTHVIVLHELGASAVASTRDPEQVRASKLETIALLAGGIAHDFNNMLTAILGNLSLARAELESTDPLHNRLAAAEQAGERARDLTRQLLTFTRGGDPVRQPIELGPVVRDAALFALRNASARCDFEIPADPWRVNADREQIAQVVQNLVVNALQAMPEGGPVAVRIENVVMAAESSTGIAPGNYVKVSVADEGVGIRENDRERVFDPFFSTKPRGIGLGLTAVHSILQRHQGHVTVESETGVGTVVSFFLPAVQVAPVVPDVTWTQPLPVKPRVLVMDDEALIREVIGLYLERQGYAAVLASEGGEAVQLYQEAIQAGARFDAVIMDLTVPGGMGGAEAVRRLAAIDPGVRAIVASGYSNDPVMANHREYGFLAALAKPFRAADLTRALDDVLRRP